MIRRLRASASSDEDVDIRSVYFFDPDGILLEFACWTRPLAEQDVQIAPAIAIGP